MWQEEKLLPVVQLTTRHLTNQRVIGNIKQASCTESASAMLKFITQENLCILCKVQLYKALGCTNIAILTSTL